MARRQRKRQVEIDPEDLERLDAYARALGAALGMPVTRADAVRVAVRLLARAQAREGALAADGRAHAPGVAA